MALIVALVGDDKTDHVIDVARAGGATGATIISSVRGEGIKPGTTFLGMGLTAKRDVLLFLVAEPRARDILERISSACGMDCESGAGVAFQLAIEDVVGLESQLPTLKEELENAL